ncbi:hypothetical protein MPER_05973, partial [Moniliophthora perniciosa FA553]
KQAQQFFLRHPRRRRRRASLAAAVEYVAADGQDTIFTKRFTATCFGFGLHWHMVCREKHWGGQLCRRPQKQIKTAQ